MWRWLHPPSPMLPLVPATRSDRNLIPACVLSHSQHARDHSAHGSESPRSSPLRRCHPFLSSSVAPLRLIARPAVSGTPNHSGSSPSTLSALHEALLAADCYDARRGDSNAASSLVRYVGSGDVKPPKFSFFSGFKSQV